ncbi:glutathione S-transferase domain protein [Fimicolochytrium jonesii]|uniref:glutathione S-transferase domain protein n=1 Tax=Fimicolochytrium jonesii TaxID=1396493 RepID=UPI0022FEDF06|nr:glutathione S-transferase domain protein [Fimicolochytrium jonesii]KAI8817575.1 glutathione S-transferase domain protein [Fimicolochytrium jonesii]
MSTPSNITLHYLNNSRAQRIIWLLDELDIKFDLKRYERGPDMRAPKELKLVHPLGKSPVITDGDKTIAESGAIVDYIVDTYGAGRLKPAAGTNEAIQYSHWLHFAEGSLMFPLLMTLVFGSTVKQSPFFVRPLVSGISSAVHSKFIDPELKTLFDYIEKHLEVNEYFTGSEFTAADIQMTFPLEAALGRAKEFMGPKTIAFIEKMHARPAYQQALKDTPDYAYAKVKPEASTSNL